MLAGVAGSLLERSAAAYDVALSVRTVGQGYQQRRYGASGASELLSRRRLTQYLSLSVFNIAPENWRGRDGDRNAVSFELGMRFDSDFGQFLLGRPRGPDDIGELKQNQIDVLYAYMLARDVGGRMDLQVGRQLHYDLVDFYSFDGADARVRVGRFLTTQAFGGTEVRGQMPLSAPIYEIDGTSVGSRDPATHPEQSEALRPMVGGAVAIDRGLPVDARIAYRRVFSQTVAGGVGTPQYGVNHESLSLTGGARWRDRVFLIGGARYNLLVAAWDDQQLAARWRLGVGHLLSAEYSYLAPTFDGDSIWNVFGAGAYADVRVGYDVELSAIWRGHVRAFQRTFVDSPDLRTPDACLLQRGAATACARAYGGNVGADGRGERGRARLDLYAEAGVGGWKVGGDLSGRVAVRPRVLQLEGRMTVYAWRADGVPQPRDVLMVGVGLGALYEMSRNMRLHFLAENNAGTYYRAQIRGLAVLEVDVTL
ncbi:MAG: hypothetical protein H7X95_04785 [Deltaproteobacteria bacterium]|nr:hypothetical protein [Deltaproteobacteria bacterium]